MSTILKIAFLLCCLSSPSAKASVVQRCLTWLFGFGSSGPSPARENWIDSAGMRLTLQGMAERIRQTRSQAIPNENAAAQRVGSRITSSGQEFVIRAILGDGAEGVVYLVTDAQGRTRVIKQFYNRPNNDLGANLSALSSTARRLGLRSPGILSTDSQNRTVVMEYVNGVPVHEILDHGPSYGLSPAEIESVRSRFRVPLSYDHSVVLDLATGDFVLIDPH